MGQGYTISLSKVSLETMREFTENMLMNSSEHERSFTEDLKSELQTKPLGRTLRD